ncbi:MAG TPA: mechanosensitive ion channel family protein [Oculatellaceae cyanobacterium]
MKSLLKKALPIVMLVALAVLTGAADWLKSATHVSLLQTLKDAIVAVGPFARHVLIAGIIAYLAYWRYPSARAHVQAWCRKLVSQSGVTPRVTEVTQSAFPLIYWVLTAILCAYALDSSLFIYSGAVLVGIGYLYKAELNHLGAGILMQLTAKAKIGDDISYESPTSTVNGKVLEIGPLYTILEVDGGEVRINNDDLWSKAIKLIRAGESANKTPAA